MPSEFNHASPSITQEQWRRQEQELRALRKEVARLSLFEQEHTHQTGLLQQLIQLIPIGVAVHTNGIATFINQAGVAIMKAPSADAILGTPAIEFVHPDFRQGALKRIQTLLAAESETGSAVAPYVEEKFRRLDGEMIDVEVAAFPLQKSGDDPAVLVLFSDVTERKRQKAALLEREARFRQLISLLPDATIIHKNNKILFANQGAVKLLKVNSVADIIGRSMFDFLHPAEVEKVQRRLQELYQKRQPLPVEKEHLIRGDGDNFLAEIRVFPFEEGGEQAVLVVMWDITEREQMLKALEKSEAKFRTLAELLPASVFIADKAGKILYINAASQDILGYSVEESLANDFLARVRPSPPREDIPAVEIGEYAHFEQKVRDKWGKWRWLDVSFTKTVMDDRVVGLGVATDSTWRKETEIILKRQAQKLVNAYEEERGRIARELHDEVGQQLIGMKFALETAQRHSESEACRTAIADARQILAALTENVRELSLSFRPSMLDDLGLLPAALWRFDRYTARTGIQVAFDHAGLANRRFPQATEITAYRVIQEALTNIARHAQADAVSVSMQAAKDHIRIVITDNGVGFEPQNVLDTYASSGLTGMQERVHLLGGDLSIESAPGQGATITAIIPLIEA